jgi:hypothetical protein
MGVAVLEKLIDLQHKNLYYCLRGSGDYMEQYRAQFSNSAVAGFSTNVRTRPLIVSKLEEMIRNRKVRTYSERTYEEFKSFVWNNGKAQATRSTHDDLVISLSIACFIRDTVFDINQTDIEYKKAMLSAIIVDKGSYKVNNMMGPIAGIENQMARNDEYGNAVINLNVREYKQNSNYVLPYPIIMRG